MSGKTWDQLRHAQDECRGTWTAEVCTEHRWDDDGTTGMRVICTSCGVMHEARAWTRATDQPEDDVPVPELHRPRLSVFDSLLANCPESFTETAAGLTLRGTSWGWWGQRKEGPQVWDAIAAGRVVGHLERYVTAWHAVRWRWNVLDQDQHWGRAGEGCHTRAAAAKAIAAARSVVAS
jgi:hypothetical protein